MSGDPKAGTPDPAQQAANQAGTAVAGQDGGESGAAPKPVDPALAMAWKQKAEDYNKVEKELAEARAMLEQARQFQQAQQQQPTDAAQAAYQRVYQDAAAGDPYAQVQLMNLQAAQQNSVMAQVAIDLATVPDNLRETVRDLVAQSGWRMSVADARRQAEELSRGKQYDTLSTRIAALEQENKALKASQEAARRTVSTSVVPAAAPEPGSYDLTGSEYRATLSRGGPEALALKAAVDSGQKRVDYTR